MDVLRITARNVNYALTTAVKIMSDPHVQEKYSQASRNGQTLEWPTPVITTYLRPLERVLFSRERDANPFFHLFESLWMLAGRRDVAFVSRMVKRMASFSDDGASFHGAYGHRWRCFFGMDQIQEIVEMLRKDPDSRRAVLDMWHPSMDLGTPSRDIPCNTQVYFKVRDGALRMTITCRSNDVIWGAYGANAVHFSMLQEYIAGKLQVNVGPMYQLSDSWHIYIDSQSAEVWDRLRSDPYKLCADLYEDGQVAASPLCANAEWDDDLALFFMLIDERGGEEMNSAMFRTQWWSLVAVPMWRAWLYRDVRELEACAATDWHRAGLEWLARHPAQAVR